MEHKQPKVAVDIIIEVGDGNPIKVVLIKRKNYPFGWAIPGGYVDYGESLESAAFREAEEETNLKVGQLHQLRTYSDPDRDPRGHTISTVFVSVGSHRDEMEALGKMKAKDDAVEIGIFAEDSLPKDIAFDHREILRDYFMWTEEL